MPCKVYLHAPRISKINVDFSQMQTGFNPLQGPPAASAATAQFYPVPASSAQYGMMAPGMLAGNPMIAQGIYPVQSDDAHDSGDDEEGTYIATPMAIPTTMMSAGNIPPPPPYTPQMAQSFHAQQANQQFHATMVPGIVHGVLPGQMIAGVPVNAHIVEDQRKGKHFHEQQMKLKLFGRLGVVSSDPDRMIESMFGKVPKSKPKVHIPQTSQTVTTTNTTTTTAIDSDPDSFGDFMQGPSSEQSEKSWMGSLGFSSSSSENNPAKAPPPVNEEEEEETKDLMAMMLQYSDLNVSQKAKTFQNKKTLRETNPTNVITSKSASYTSSERSRKWQDGDESLSGLFKVEDQPPVTPDVSSNMQPQCTTPDSGSTTPTVSQYPMGPFQTLPSWCYLDDDQIPHVYRQVYEASSANDCIITDRLYPILLLSDLPRQTLREIWEVCNMTTPGQLSKQELYLLLSLIAVAQNNQGIPSMEILHQLPSPPVPFFNQASATQITPTQQNAVTSFGASSPPSFATQDASLASGGTLLPNSSSTVRPPTSVPFESTPTSLLETTFGLNASTQLSTSQSAPVFGTFSKEVTQTAPTENLYGDEDFADFQVAPKITSDSLDQFNMSPVTDVTQVNCNSITPVTKVAFEALPELSAEDKYSNVRNFFCSDDSSGTSTNSFDDDYDDFKSADSKPSDDTSQFSTSEQSEGEDFKALDLYVDDFKSRRNMQQVPSPNLSSTRRSFHLGDTLFPNNPQTPPKSPIPTTTPLPSGEIVPPLLSKPPGANNLASTVNVGSFANLSSIKAQKAEGCTEFKTADLNAVEDEYSDFKAAPIIHSMKKEIEMATNQLDKYAVFRQLNYIEDDLQSMSLSSASSTLNQKSDSTSNDSRQSGDQNTTENWADFQSALQPAGHDPQSNIPPPYDIAVKNSVLASNVNPVDDDDPGWAEFQVSSNSSLNNWADFTQMAPNSGENTSIHPPKVGSSTNSFSEKKQSVESDGSNFDVESGNSANSNGSSLVTIVKDNLQRREILSLFKVRENVPRENTISHEDTLTRNDGVEGTKRNASKKEKAKVKLDNSAGSSQNFQQQPSAISASNVSLNLSSEIDLFHEPPPLDDSVEGEDEFGGFSRGIDSFDFTERTGFPASVPCSNLRPGPVHMPKGRNVEAYSSENQSTCQPGNFDFADEDSHSSKDTDSLSWQDNNKFQKEDSQSVSSLELSYNSAGRQNQRDPDMAADSQSVSSSEFPAFETLQKQETTLESKSLDSLEFRNDDQGWGEICDNNGENVPDDNKNRCVQNLTAETPVGTMPTLPQPVPPQTVVNKENLIARDRYSSVIQDVQGSEHHCHEWTKCLDKCYQTSCVCNEVIKSCQGADYIMAIIEIYRVVCKITVTMRMSVLTNERLETLLKDIDLAWNNLAAFLSASSLLSEVSSFNYTSAVLKTDDTASQLKACGVCLLNVDVFDRISNDNERAAKLTYSGRQYHTTCANFWVNCVDSMLPALKLPQLI
eukprot:XP_014768319.1 PREDICTED: synergin gamma-like [Octopus bimaculoides]